MITMSEIAKLTRVSQPTVSRVLNGNQSVDPEIRERVLACAREHNYQLNALAKSLQGSRTMLLGVLVTDISNSFFADLAKAIEGEAKDSGYSIILFNSDYSIDREQEYLDVLRRYRVDGVVAVPVLNGSSAWPGCASRLDVPIVVVTRHVDGLDSVYLDHEEASCQVARHLIEQGYGRFLFIGQNDDTKYKGFQQGVQRLSPGSCVQSLEYQGDDLLKEGLRTLLQEPGPRVGIYANNDICALQTLRVLQELEVAVPGEVGVVGFDNTYMGRYLNPALTSVSQPIEEIAQTAVARLTERISFPGEYQALDRPLHASLVIRESSKPLKN